MRMWERVRNQIVQGILQFTYGATIKIEDPRNTEVTLTQAHLHALRNMQVCEVVTAARTLTAADSGLTLFLSAVAGFPVTLPAPALGLNYRLVVKTAPTSNGYTLNTASGADILVVSVNELETDTGDDGPSDDNADIMTFVANIAAKGDFVDITCDGTNWYALGQTKLDGAVTSATT